MTSTPTGPWRTGRSVGRTVYVQVGNEASKRDVLIGVMDSPTLAHLVCVAVNAYNAAAAPDTRETEAGSGR